MRLGTPEVAGKVLGLVLAAALAAPAAAAEFKSATPLPQGYVGHALLYASGHLYNVGGLGSVDGVLGADRTWYAKIQAPGVLQAWQEGPRLPEPLFFHASAATENTLYVMGGHHFAGGLHPSVAVYYSRVGADGAPGAWQTTTPLPIPVVLHSAAVWKGFLYITGGSGPGLLSNKVYSAAIHADGSLGLWTELASLPEGIYTHATVVDGTLYVLGGAVDGGTGETDAVYYSPIRSDGTLDPWKLTTSLPMPLSSLAAAVQDERVYVMGGWSGLGPVSAVSSAHILSDKSLGAWEAGPALPKALYMHAAAVGDGAVYVSGGSDSVMSQNGVYALELSQPKLVATADLDPDTLNLVSKGKMVTLHLEFPAMCRAKAGDIDPASVRVARVNGAAPVKAVAALSKPVSVGDDDQDGIQDLMVKFDRSDLALSLGTGDNKVELEGKLKDGTPFTATATIWAISPKAPIAGRIKLADSAARQSFGSGLKVSSTSALGLVPAHGGRVRSDSKSSVDVPDGATGGALLTVSEAAGSEERDRGLRKDSLSAAGPAVEFGPEGAVFQKPVTLSLPYDASVSPDDARKLKVHYWNPQSKAWEALASRVDLDARVVLAETSHFSLYQALTGAAPAADPVGPAAAGFVFGQVYAFPNPARGGRAPAIHVEAGSADGMDIRIYDISGQKVHEASLAGPAPLVDDGSGRGAVQAFEYSWDVSGTGSGVYIYMVSASKAGIGTIRKSGKVAVIK